MSVINVGGDKPWEARVHMPPGWKPRHPSRRFARKRDAQEWEAEMRRQRDRGVRVDPSAAKATVAEYAAGWVSGREPGLRPNTRRAYGTWLHQHIEPTPLGSRPVAQVKPSEIQAWANSRAKLMGPRTLREHVTRLRSVFAAAVLDGVRPDNPVLPARGPSGLSLPRISRRRVVPLTGGQVAAWAAAAPPRVRAMILTQAGLGLRISELRALRVQDVNWPLATEVRVTAQLDPSGTSRVDLKTERSERTIPLPATTARVLAAHLAQFPASDDGLIFHPEWWGGAAGWTLGGALGKYYRDSAVAAGLPAGTSSHDLRHHYCSVLLAAGQSVHAVAERIGDAPARVLETYGHLMPDRDDETRQAIDAVWAAAGDEAARGTR